jgi:hypothetical protein
VSDEAVAALAARFPNAEIDVRKGGKLGVGGQRIVGPCQITQVVAGSAADRAFFLELYGLSVREHQLASRRRLKRRPQPHPSSTAQAA